MRLIKTADGRVVPFATWMLATPARVAWEDRVMRILQSREPCITHGDAQGMLEARDMEVASWFDSGFSAVEAAQLLLDGIPTTPVYYTDEWEELEASQCNPEDLP